MEDNIKIDKFLKIFEISVKYVSKHGHWNTVLDYWSKAIEDSVSPIT